MYIVLFCCCFSFEDDAVDRIKGHRKEYRWNTKYCKSVNKVDLSAIGIIQRMLKKIAMTCDFQQCAILTSEDSDDPVQPPVKLRNSK